MKNENDTTYREWFECNLRRNKQDVINMIQSSEMKSLIKHHVYNNKINKNKIAVFFSLIKTNVAQLFKKNKKNFSERQINIRNKKKNKKIF